MICDTCGQDHHPDAGADGGADLAEVADAIVEAAEVEAAADIERAEINTEAEIELTEDSNDTREAVAKIEADAAVAIAEAQADAAVAIAEAEAVALVGDVDQVEPATEPEPTEPEEEPAGEAQSVAVPPQIDDDPARPTKPATTSVSRFRARRR